MRGKSHRPLQGRHAVITGASRGIGLAISSELARLGANVTLMARSLGSIESNAKAIRDEFGVRAEAVAVDVSLPESIQAAFAGSVERIGPPSLLINNAGIAIAAPIGRTTLEQWTTVMDVDLRAPFLCIQQVLKGMTASGFGRVVNVGSTAGLTGYPYVTAYCAAKHGVIGLTRSLAMEVAKSGVTVNAVCPGYTKTDIVENALDNIVAKTGRSREEALAELVTHNPQQRLIEPDEIASVVGWLCLPESSSINGQSILVAGGELM